MRTIIICFLFIVAVSAAEAKLHRSVTVEIVKPLLPTDTCDILVAPRGQSLVKVGTATPLVSKVVVSNLVVGNVYDFTSIVRRGSLRSVQPPPLHYTITKAFNQKLLGVAP